MEIDKCSDKGEDITIVKKGRRVIVGNEHAELSIELLSNEYNLIYNDKEEEDQEYRILQLRENKLIEMSINEEGKMKKKVIDLKLKKEIVSFGYDKDMNLIVLVG